MRPEGPSAIGVARTSAVDARPSAVAAIMGAQAIDGETLCLTMNLYTHIDLPDKARAIGKLAVVGG